MRHILVRCSFVFVLAAASVLADPRDPARQPRRPSLEYLSWGEDPVWRDNWPSAPEKLPRHSRIHRLLSGRLPAEILDPSEMVRERETSNTKKWLSTFGHLPVTKEVSGKLADPRIRSLSSVDAAGAVWAAFDGAEVRLNDGALGRGVSAERHSLAMSLPRNASSVSIALAEGAAFEASVGPEGRGIMRAEGIHAPQTELWVQRHLHVAASAHVLQLPDPDWTLHAGASLSVEVPKVVWIRFAPDF